MEYGFGLRLEFANWNGLFARGKHYKIIINLVSLKIIVTQGLSYYFCYLR